MDDAVAGLDVRSGDGGIVDHDLAVLDLDGDRLAQDGVGRGQLGGVGGHDLAGDDVVEQDVLELGRVLEQAFDRAGGQLGEGLVGGGEDGERAGALERVDQAGGLNGGDEGREAAVGDGGIDDVLSHRIGRRGRGGRNRGGGGRRRRLSGRHRRTGDYDQRKDRQNRQGGYSFHHISLL